jgi:hypothetical protein
VGEMLTNITPMKVGEFVSKFIGYPNYASDRLLLNKYADVDLLAYCAAGGGKYFTTVMIFKTARMLVAFVNGVRRPLQFAFVILDNVRVVKHAPSNVMADLRTQVVLDNL